MVSDPGVDYIVRGEAEHSFVQFLRELGWGYRIRSVVDFAPLCQNLDELPFPDREFLYKYPENRDNPIKNVLTSRGCLFSCPYCFNSLYRSFYRGQRWVRYRSPENVVAECRDLMRYPTKMIYFQDDELLTNPKFFDLMRLYETKVRIPFHCQIRIELLTRPIAFWLKLAGCAGVTFAIESGNDYIRGNLLKRRMSREAIMRGVDLLRQFGIKFRIENMVGLPGEGVDEMLETLDLNIQCAPDYGWASIFQPYPKLPLAEYAKSLGAWDGQVDEFSESFFEHTVLKNGRKEIANMQRLFGVAVSFPAVRTFIRTLLRLPNNAIYDKISKTWKRNRFRRLYSEAYS